MQTEKAIERKEKKRTHIEWIFTIFGMPQRKKNMRKVNKIIKSAFLSVNNSFEEGEKVDTFGYLCIKLL